MTIIFVKNFSTTPGARYRKLGKASGEEFRDDVLVPAIENNPNLIVNLDGVRGYGSSFLDEAFAGLVRLKMFSIDVIKKVVSNIQTENPYWKQEIQTYVDEAINQQNEGNA